MSLKRGFYLADDTNPTERVKDSPKAPYDYDGRGAVIPDGHFRFYPLKNAGKGAPTAIIRELREVDSGVVTLKMLFSCRGNPDGTTVRLYDAGERDAVRFTVRENALSMCEKKLAELSDVDKHLLLCTLDLDHLRGTGALDGKTFTFPISGTGALHYASFGTAAGSHADPFLHRFEMFSGFILNEEFALYPSGILPQGWTIQGNGRIDGEDFVLEGSSRLSTDFAPVEGLLCLEAFLFMPTFGEGACLSVHDENGMAFSLKTACEGFYACGKLLRKGADGMWYRLRLETDTERRGMRIKINGKVCGDFPLSLASVCGVAFSLDNGAGTLRLDRIKLFYLTDDADYPPPPVIPEKKKPYVIGVNMCSLWRTGMHIGWDCITPFDEAKPVIGYYDEGLPEVADWENKFMAEHGVDFQMYCWYASQSDAPMKTTMLSEAIHDGYFNSRYSACVRFALLWETAGGRLPASPEAFRKYYIPYWIEHFFSDKRYMRIDGKAIMAVFAPQCLIRVFGSPETVKKEFEFLRKAVCGCGYDGLIILACGMISEEIAACGFDGAYAYGWGKKGCDVGYTVSRIRAETEAGFLPIVPTASTGFNNVAWGGKRSDAITPDDFSKLHTVIRDEILPSFSGDGRPWHEKLVMLSNWNEYGEGTYIMPCEGLYDFGYLDAVREVYTAAAKPHTDVIPTDAQRLRLSYLYNQSRKRLAKQGYAERQVKVNVMASYDFGHGKFEDRYTAEETTAELTQTGSIRGISLGTDPKITTTCPVHIDLSGATHLRIRVKVSDDATVQMFYLTDKDITWNGKKCFSFALKKEEEQALCAINSAASDLGPITAFRMDPSSAIGIRYELFGFDLIRDDEMPRCYVDGRELETAYDLTESEDGLLYPFDPHDELTLRLGIAYTYDGKEKKLTLRSADSFVTVTVGSKRLLTEGNTVMLSRPISLYDGLPLLPLRPLSERLGFRYCYDAPVLRLFSE